MQEMQPIRELSDEELEGVVGGSASIGTGINVTAFAAGGHVNRTFAATDSETFLTARGKGISFAFGFAVALDL
jgi:hypothetical protein